MKNFKEFIKNAMEEASSASIEKVDNKLWEIRKRNLVPHTLENKDAELEDNDDEKLKEHIKMYILLK
jgi:DNA polymerase IIIc chi subunit